MNQKVSPPVLTPDFFHNLIFEGDAHAFLSALPPEVVHLTFTSPPYYNARDYSQYSNYTEYLDTLEAIFSEVHRVTQPGRFLVVNSSPVIEPRAHRQAESRRYPIPYDIHHRLTAEGAWEFVDDIVWLKPAGSAKNRNGGFYQHRKPIAYKPNCITEMLMVYRKAGDALIDRTLAAYPKEIVDASLVADGYEITNVWALTPCSHAVHPAVFPMALAERVIAYYSMEGDTVLDPFGGVGTTAHAALRQKRNFMLCEQNPEYLEAFDAETSLWEAPFTRLTLKTLKSYFLAAYLKCMEAYYEVT